MKNVLATFTIQDNGYEYFDYALFPRGMSNDAMLNIGLGSLIHACVTWSLLVYIVTHPNMATCSFLIWRPRTQPLIWRQEDVCSTSNTVAE